MNIPVTWKAALGIVQRYAPEAVIAGGCLRDLDMGKTPKDIDIFVGCSHRERWDALLSLFNKLMVSGGIDAAMPDPGKMYPVGEGNDVVGFFEARFEGLELPVQIIMVDLQPTEDMGAGPFLPRVLNRLDYGICRIGFDGVAVQRSAEYLVDKEQQVFRMRHERTEESMPSSIHRFARLCGPGQKYAGWSWMPYVEEWVL